MSSADQRGRLFALAGDRVVRPDPDAHSLAEVAETLDLDIFVVLRAWRAFGLADTAADAKVASPADLEVFGIYRSVLELVGEDAALGMCRVIGSAAGRVAEAESSAVRLTLPEINVSRTQSELVTAQAWAGVARLVPDVGRVLDVIHRHHVELVRRHFEEILVPTSLDDVGLRLGVGFADLSGFTELSRRLPLGGLSRVLSAFEASAAEAVQDGGGRVVKFIGDAVMFVSPTAARLAAIAVALVHHPRARDAGLPVRAGCAFGPVLAQEGDYFGPTVNLAARLTAIAGPGIVLVNDELTVALSRADWTIRPRPPQTVRGFTEPVSSFEISPLAGP